MFDNPNMTNPDFDNDVLRFQSALGSESFRIGQPMGTAHSYQTVGFNMQPSSFIGRPGTRRA